MSENPEANRGTDEQILTERKLTCEAIDGAMAFGYQNTNPPPSDDHWLAPYWKIGRKQAELEVALSGPAEAQPVAVAELPSFPTMLRKMWSGGEVQRWIDDNIKPLMQEQHHDFHVAEPVSVAPEGWRVVPEHVTDNMIDAANNTPSGIAGSPPHWQHVWDCMLDAAPAAPQAPAVSAVDRTPPFSNCRFRECDLPGQCRSEGKCHHPVTTAPARSEQESDRDAYYRGWNAAIAAFSPVNAPYPTARAEGGEAVADLESIAKKFLQEDDAASLFVFKNQCEDLDADGYTERAETMNRLAELGVVQRILGRGRRFSVTAFGSWLIEAEFTQKPLLPLRTIAEHNARETAGHALYLKEAPPHSIAWMQLPRNERESWRVKAQQAEDAEAEMIASQWPWERAAARDAQADFNPRGSCPNGAPCEIGCDKSEPCAAQAGKEGA